MALVSVVEIFRKNDSNNHEKRLLFAKFHLPDFVRLRTQGRPAFEKRLLFAGLRTIHTITNARTKGEKVTPGSSSGRSSRGSAANPSSSSKQSNSNNPNQIGLPNAHPRVLPRVNHNAAAKRTLSHQQLERKVTGRNRRIFRR